MKLIQVQSLIKGVDRLYSAPDSWHTEEIITLANAASGLRSCDTDIPGYRLVVNCLRELPEWAACAVSLELIYPKRPYDVAK